MGAPKQKWTSEEEDALRAGVDKHGPGKWRTIQKDPEFSHLLATRSNIDLKDKWRNISASASGQGSREKSRMLKHKGASAISFSCSQGPAISAPVKGLPTIMDPPSKDMQDGKAIPRYTQLIMEALKIMPEPEGIDTGAIYRYIEQKIPVQQNFRRLLSSKLRRLAAQNKIAKGLKGYMLKESFATKTPTPRQKDLTHHRPKMPHISGFCRTTNAIEEASITAAYKIADAEAKAYLASEAIKEAEKVSRMAEETDSLLQIAKEIYERCGRGEIVTMA
ncbi:single myb histone 4-like [Dioscorea cayenensis subsp. rotundata]|uniref:Single myb histone 4-like n=1 Tax=Dioscorea cayennensis subsp. rotundata TaxID=55577 RepID=A0AB40ANB4_DIOCR|nr:single myb histone 4-like [Dioscorea cayenensis subsp. rotundata]